MNVHLTRMFKEMEAEHKYASSVAYSNFIKYATSHRATVKRCKGKRCWNKH